MLLGLGSFVGPLQGIRLGDSFIDRVQSTRCLGVEVDCRLKWDSHMAELIKSFAQKLSFLGNCISHQLMPELIFISRLFYPLSPMASLCGGHVEKHFLGNLNSCIFVRPK